MFTCLSALCGVNWRSFDVRCEELGSFGSSPPPADGISMKNNMLSSEVNRGRFPLQCKQWQ